MAAGSACLRRAAKGKRREVARFDRFLGHPAVTAEGIVAHWGELTALAAEGRDVLAIQDTTEVSFRTSPGRRRGLGPVGKGNKHGLLLHAMLALDAGTGECLGLVDGRVWTRAGKAGPHRQRPREERESERWLATARSAGSVLEAARQVTVVADREADIYAAWATVPGDRLHLLGRASADRRLAGGGSLHAAAAALPAAGTRVVTLPDRPGRPGRDATLEVRFGEVLVRRPDGAGPGLPAQVALRVVRAAEADPPPGAEPLCWHLLTTHAVADAAEAWRMLGLYARRWAIEQFFRLLKGQGLGLEDSQVESAGRPGKLAVVAARAAVVVMQLLQGRDGPPGAPATLAFTPDEVDLLERVLARRYPPRTRLQANPHPPRSLAWAAWVVARLGGWDGNPRTKPGPITLANGLRSFQDMAAAWALRDT